MKEQDLQKQAASNPVEMERTRNRKVYIPRVDIYETKESIVLLADMPGVDESSVDIMLEKNVLTINGTVEPIGFPGHNLVYAEYDTGDYQRAFTLPEEIDQNKIEAMVKNGVLRVVLQKAEKSKARKIAIKAA